MSRHLPGACPAAPVAAPKPEASARAATSLAEGTIRWGLGTEMKLPRERYVGQAMRAPKSASGGAAGLVVVVVDVRSTFIREDGLSFGLPDDSGWSNSFFARPATEAETTTFEAREAEEREEEARKTAERLAAAEALKAKVAASRAQRDDAIRGLETGGDSGFSWRAVEGELAKVVSWEDDYGQIHVTMGTLKNGERIVRVVHDVYDDTRVAFYSTPAGISFVYETFLAEQTERATQDGRPLHFTPETARAWLTRYDGCAGSEFQRWLAGSDGGPVPTKAATS